MLVKKILSYFFPFTKKIPSDHSGIVELTYYNGKKMLNTANANYSYDSGQRLLKFGLTNVVVEKSGAVLVLGMGGGSVIKTLRDDFNFAGKITAIEFDRAIIAIAETEFSISPGENLEIIHTDAYDFVQETKQCYNLVIIDLFIDTEVPPKFYTMAFWTHITNLIVKDGYFIFNASLNNAKGTTLKNLLEELNTHFIIEHFEKTEGINTLVTGKKKS